MASANETEVFQHYQVLKRPDGALWELGRGAMGITYKAFDTNLRCDVALKVINALHLDSETARARFLREARAAAGLRHRNVASVYHLGNDDQSFFYAMEFVDGETVECLVKETGAMPPIDALQIVVQIARALGAAAKQNLVHRDIKPANIMVTREDDEEEQFVVKVIDFGLARPAIGGEGSAHITMGGFVGTPQFASPEQLEEKDLDARSDIYSLGVTLWFMIAGRPPFTGPLGSVFIQQLTKEPPWAQLEGTPAPVKALLAGMLEKDPDKRPQTPLELRRQVETCLRQLPAAEPQIKPPAHREVSPLADSITGTEAPVTRSVIWSPGSVIADRFELAELAGEGTNGRVFRGIDRQGGNLAVAIKILHGDVLASSSERRRIEGELEKLRGAAHPNLLEFQGLRESADTSFLVGEWLNGFTLVDLLRSRGQLPLPETLRLLAQAAVVADHARASDLRRLELCLHQVMTEFDEPGGAGLDTRGALTASLDAWPSFVLKFDALGITREAGDSVTWSGDQTMLPAAALLGRDTQTSIRGFVEGSDLFALGLMAYELLNGAPPAHSQRGGGREARYVALPALNEPANLILRRALSPNPGFATNVDFFKALVDASDLPEIYLGDLEGAENDSYAVERLPVSGAGAEEAGATLILGDGESIGFEEPITARGPSADERAQAEAERAERETARKAEANRLRAKRAETQRIAAEKAAAERAEAERIAAEKAQAARLEKQRLDAELKEVQRVEAERAAEAKRIAAEKVAAERREADRLAAERAEAERIETERIAAEKAETRRLEGERREAERLAAEKLAAERAEAKRIETERLAAERAEAKRQEAERLKIEKAEADRLNAERAEAKRIETERIAAERAEARRQETERLKIEKAEAERLNAERTEAKRVEAARVKAEKAEIERVKAEKAQAERLEADRLKTERAEIKRAQTEKAQAEKEEADRQRAAVALLRDDAAASGVDAPQKKDPKVLAGVAGGIVVLGIVGAITLMHGHHAATPVVSKTTKETPSAVATVIQPEESPAPQPTVAEMAAATPPSAVPSPSPETVAVTEPSPTPVAIPETSATPALAEMNVPTPAAATPEPAGKSDDSDDQNNRRDARAAKLAEEKKHQAEAAADADRQAKNERAAEKEKSREREHSTAAAEPKKPAQAKPKPVAEAKPKPTPAPANRPSGPFILR